MTQKIQLTPDQQFAADDFYKFLMTDDPIFVLSGGAGVGKTFLMNYISNTIMQTYQDSCALMNVKPKYETVVFTATTNKAAEVLENSINAPVQTIHSFLGLKVKEDYKTGKTTLETTTNYKVRHKHVLFIDESSMIDTALYNLILMAFKDSKIVFVGDHAQMSPINEEKSPIYLNVDPNNFVFLGTPVRNAETPALVALCAQLRETVETGVFNYMAPVPGVIEYLSPEQMQQKLTDHFQESNEAVRVLSYTNSRVQNYNAFIREVRGQATEFEVGDHLIVATAYQRGKMSLSVEREVVVTGISDQVEEGGYGNMSADRVPLYYQMFDIKLPAALEADSAQVKVVTDPMRLQDIIKALGKQKRWSEYFELKSTYLDLRDKYACTVYKSQGSTYDTVFIDLGNIGTSYDAKQVARMLFVGVSRATTRIYFYGNLPGKYQGRQAA